ncbi:uncharacterized protein LOC132054013 [Lycium ferocissimum]|uniref:uncharacterized protein LOC132054013 n=1 Tax=Lycium ferocissimum TaxID=112874 RepID=UPI002815F9A9|nr:uncharacterized protein LOC132054013 [Lycium ferocissimum]
MVIAPSMKLKTQSHYQSIFVGIDVTRTFIGNPAHNVDRGYQHMAGRHEALALGHQESYRLAQETIQDPTKSNEVKELAEMFSHINTESMTAASLGTMLSFALNYTPPAEYIEPPTVEVPRRQRPNVPRLRRVSPMAFDVGSSHIPVPDVQTLEPQLWLFVLVNGIGGSPCYRRDVIRFYVDN